jgi:DNA-binding transcriptional MerR regulator
MPVSKYYSITELTREFGVSTRTLRFYEDEGLIHPERRGRTRCSARPTVV